MLKGYRFRLVAVLAAAVAVMALGSLLLDDTGSSEAAAQTPAAAPAPSSTAAASHPFSPRPDWLAGTRYVYALEWRSEEHAVPPMPSQGPGQKAQAMDGSLRVSGDLVLRALGHDAEGFLLSASLENLREVQLSLSSQPMPDTATLTAALTGHEALVELTPAGNLRLMRFSPGDPDFFRHTMQWLLTHVQPTLPDDEARARAGRWEVLEDSSRGQVRAVYEVQAGRPLTVRRTRTGYTRLHVAPQQQGAPPQRLESRATFTFSDGHLSGVDHLEAISARDESGVELLDARELLKLTLREVGRFAVPEDVGLASHTEVRRPGIITTSDRVQRRLLEQRAAGMTMEQLLADLLKHGAHGELPDHNRWLWQATGRLLLEPGRCKELKAAFERPDMGNKGRALVLDLLASAGHAEAQAVMRELLETRAAHEDAQAYELLVQRLGLVERPEKESLEYLVRKYEDAARDGQEHVRNASAYALGAAVGRRGAEDAEAARYNQLLLNGLGTAGTVEERETYLRALGNAGRAENVSAVMGLEGDPDERVRSAVAAALRKTDSPESTAALLRLAQAPERPVQAEALAALREHSLDAGALGALRELVLSGNLRQGVAPVLVSLLEARLDAGPEVVEMLRYLAQSVKDDPSLRTHILELLARATRPGRVP